MTRIAAVVLAAGRSSRFRAAGGAEKTKLVAKLEGKPIVRRVVDAALASRARPVVVVVGHARGAVEAALAGLACDNRVQSGLRDRDRFLAQLGLAATPATSDGAVVLLGDMPNVAPRLIDELIGAFEARPTAHAVAPIGRRGDVEIRSSSRGGLFEEAMRLVGDEGARRLLVALDPRAVAEIAADLRRVFRHRHAR